MKMLNSVVTYYAEHPDQLTLQFVLFLLVILLFRANRIQQDKIISAKESEIQRLADDNRKYREIYLTKIHGMSKDQLRKISAPTLRGKKKEK